MQNKSRKLVISIAIVGVALVAVLALVFVLLNYTFAAGGMYAKNAQTLDLRGEDISVEDFRELSQELPDCDIIWEVPFQGRRHYSLETEIWITELTEEDVLTLDYLTALETIHAEDCTNYAQLVQLQQRHPGSTVLYTVPIAGEDYDQDTQSLKLTKLSEADAAKLCYLPKLNQVEVSGCEDYALLQRLQREYPQWNLTYTVAIGGEEFSWDVSSVTVAQADYDALEAAMPGLPGLQTLNLKNPDAQARQLLQLREDYPDVDIHWEVELYGQTVKDDVKELDISGIQVESCEEVEQLVACLPELEKLIMSDCGIDNETMAQFRERQRENYKVVWTVYFSEDTHARTDDIYFMPIQQGEFYFLDSHTENLKYCEDMICLDLGHHPIRNIEFVAYMPHLKYLILAHTEVQDVSPIVHCQELVYLEVDWSAIRDYTPIAELRALEDLNINKTYCDITPILEMTWLKNLWAPGRSYTDGQLLLEALPDTHVELRGASPIGEGWRDLQNYFDMRDLLGMPYMR